MGTWRNQTPQQGRLQNRCKSLDRLAEPTDPVREPKRNRNRTATRRLQVKPPFLPLLTTFIAASRHRRLKVLQKYCRDPALAPCPLRGPTQGAKDLRDRAGAERPGNATQTTLQLEKYQYEPTPTHQKLNRAKTPDNGLRAGMHHCCGIWLSDEPARMRWVRNMTQFFCCTRQGFCT